MPFETGREKTGGRKRGSSNKRTMRFSTKCIQSAKREINLLVEKGDFEACKLVVQYTMSKPAPYASHDEPQSDD